MFSYNSNTANFSSERFRQLPSNVFERNPNATVPVQTQPFYRPYSHCDDGLHTPHQNVPMRIGRAVNQRQNDGYGWRNLASGFFGVGGGTWSREQDMFFDPTHPREMSLGFSRDDIEYAKITEKRNRDVIMKMNSRQKRLLQALEHGCIFKLSRLKLENKRG